MTSAAHDVASQRRKPGRRWAIHGTMALVAVGSSWMAAAPQPREGPTAAGPCRGDRLRRVKPEVAPRGRRCSARREWRRRGPSSSTASHLRGRPASSPSCRRLDCGGGAAARRCPARRRRRRGVHARRVPPVERSELTMKSRLDVAQPESIPAAIPEGRAEGRTASVTSRTSTIRRRRRTSSSRISWSNDGARPPLPAVSSSIDGPDGNADRFAAHP